MTESDPQKDPNVSGARSRDGEDAVAEPAHASASEDTAKLPREQILARILQNPAPPPAPALLGDDPDDEAVAIWEEDLDEIFEPFESEPRAGLVPKAAELLPLGELSASTKVEEPRDTASPVPPPGLPPTAEDDGTDPAEAPGQPKRETLPGPSQVGVEAASAAGDQSDAAPTDPAEESLRGISSFLAKELSGTETQPCAEEARAEPAPPELPGKNSPAYASAAAADPPAEVSTPAIAAAATAAVATESVSQPQPASAEPFFPIPDHVPEIPVEDTEEVPRSRRRIRKRRRGGRFVGLVNAAAWMFLLMGFAVVIAGVFYLRYAYDRLHNPREGDERLIVLTVNAGDRFQTIVRKMEDAGLLGRFMGIPDRLLMFYLTKVEGNSERIQAGAYQLSMGMSLGEVYRRLLEGSKDFTIVIPEGRTIRNVAATVRKKIDSFDEDRFVALAEDPAFIASLGFDLPSLEGYLFPSKYFFGPGMGEDELLRMMVRSFREMAENHLKDLPKDSLSFHEHVILASLIEREARKKEERPLIASVLLNRLEKGMPLQVDATLQYALGDYSRPPRPEDKKIDSPYNTYLHKGLPPGPICSPGLDSLLATYAPAKTDYLYYVHKGDGYHAFARTYEEHKENIRLYLRTEPPDAPETGGLTRARKADSPARR